MLDSAGFGIHACFPRGASSRYRITGGSYYWYIYGALQENLNDSHSNYFWIEIDDDHLNSRETRWVQIVILIHFTFDRKYAGYNSEVTYFWKKIASKIISYEHLVF